MEILSASFREVTPQEAVKARGHWLWRVIGFPFTFCAKSIGTIAQLWSDRTARQNPEPLPLSLWHGFRSCFIYTPSRIVVKELPTFQKTHHFLTGNEILSRALFSADTEKKLFHADKLPHDSPPSPPEKGDSEHLAEWEAECNRSHGKFNAIQAAQQLADSLLRNEHPVHIDAERRERLKQLILSLWLTLAGEITHQQELRSLSNRLLTQMKMENVDPIPKAIEELVSECLHRLVTNYRLHRELDRDICLEFNLSTAPAISHSVYFFKGDALHIQIKDEPTAYAWTSMDHALHRRPETTQILHEVGQSLMLLLNNYRLLPTESSEKAQLGSHPLLNCNHELFLRLEKITPARSS